jgi:D-alanine-D-alanine ligase-like ATP-grasp enzyme
MSPLTVDLDCILTLRRAGWSLGSIPAWGESVVVKGSVNRSGARHTDTIPPGSIAPELLEEACTAVHACGLRLASVEMIVPSAADSLAETGGVVLEVNGTPGLHYHYLVRDPSTRTPVAVPVLQTLLDGASACAGRARPAPPTEAR